MEMYNPRKEMEQESYKRGKSLGRELWNVFVWFVIGWGAVELLAWLTDIPKLSIQIFFGGAFVMFLGLTILGTWKMAQQEKQRQAALDQFIKDQKVDVEKQAKIDKEIIAQLKHEYNLSGQEQDKRLRALEQALKHLRGK